MVPHERPCIAGCFGFMQKIGKPGEKIRIVPAAPEERRTFYAPHDDMMERTRSVYAALSRHTQ